MRRLLLTTILVSGLAGPSAAQPFDAVQLLEPTGPHAVGTVVHEWGDEGRRFRFSSHDGDLRRIAVQIWYPAENDPHAARAPYSPLSPDYRHVTAHSRIRTPFAKEVAASPLVLISPGRGVERFGYTSIAEELASHGYVVASVDMPEIGYVIYSDGYVARPNPDFRPPRELMAGPYEKVDTFFQKPTRLGREDLELALREIRRLSEADPDRRLTGKIDLSTVGVFGHSLGGRIAGALAAQNETIKAYISMEGIAPRRARFEGLLKMPVAMMCSSGTLPYARDNYQSLIDGRRDTVFMIELKGFGHNSVTDFPLATPSQFRYEIDPRVALRTSVAIVRAFFDAHLKTGPPFLEASRDLENVTIIEHAKPKNR